MIVWVEIRSTEDFDRIRNFCLRHGIKYDVDWTNGLQQKDKD